MENLTIIIALTSINVDLDIVSLRLSLKLVEIQWFLTFHVPPLVIGLGNKGPRGVAKVRAAKIEII